MANIPLNMLPSDLLYNGQLDVSNPVKQSKYNQLNSQWQATQGNSSSNSGGVANISSATDPTQTLNNTLAAGSAIRQFNIDSAQPQIQTLQNQKSDLDTQYQNLLASIKGDQQSAINNATKATNAQIAARGLSTQDPMAQQNLAGAQSQAAQPYSSLYAQTGVGQAQDEANIANQIAALQSGNPTGAVSTGLQIGGLGQQAAGLGLQANQQTFNQRYITIPGYGIYDVQQGALLGGISSTGLSPTGNQIIGQY